MIDWGKVSELRDEIGAEDFADVVELFLEEVQGTIDRLRVGVAPAALEGDLHFLKGSALNLGFRQFSNLCQKGESAAAEGRQDEIDIDPILASFDASKAEFLAELEAHLAA